MVPWRGARRHRRGQVHVMIDPEEIRRILRRNKDYAVILLAIEQSIRNKESIHNQGVSKCTYHLSHLVGENG